MRPQYVSVHIPFLVQAVLFAGTCLALVLFFAPNVFSQTDITDAALPHAADSEFPGDVAGWDYHAHNISDNMTGLDHCWHSGDERLGAYFPHWIQIDFGTPQVVTQLNLLAYGESSIGNLRLKEFWFEGSNDGTGYTPLHSTVFTYEDSHEWQTFMFENALAYRYYRVRGLNNWAAEGTLMASQMILEEWEMLANPIMVEGSTWGHIKALYR